MPTDVPTNMPTETPTETGHMTGHFLTHNPQKTELKNQVLDVAKSFGWDSWIKVEVNVEIVE